MDPEKVLESHRRPFPRGRRLATGVRTAAPEATPTTEQRRGFSRRWFSSFVSPSLFFSFFLLAAFLPFFAHSLPQAIESTAADSSADDSSSNSPNGDSKPSETPASSPGHEESPMALEEMSGNWGKVITVGPSNGIVESVLANMMGFGGSVMMIGPSSGSGVSYATEVKSEDEMLDHVKKNDVTLVLASVDWCSICAYTQPQFERAVKLLQNHKPPVRGVVIDVSHNPSFQDKYQITSFPGFLLFYSDGDYVQVPSALTTNRIVMHVNELLDLNHVVKTKEELHDCLTHSSLTVLGLFGPHNDSTGFAHAARHGGDVLFCEVDDNSLIDEIISKFHLEDLKLRFPSIMMSKPWDEKVVVFNGDIADPAAITKFVQRNRLPFFHEFTPSSPSAIMPDGRPIGFFITSHLPADVAEKAIEEMKKTAKFLKGKVIFSHVTDVSAHRRLLEFLGIEEDIDSLKPLLTFVKHNEHKAEDGRYAHKFFRRPYEDWVGNSQKVEDFIDKFVSGEISPSYKSEDPPERQTAPIQTLVGSNFGPIIDREKRDVFVMFYASWCGHCKHAEPIFRQVARRLDRIDSIVLAKLDATANEVPRFNIEAYPTFLLFKASDTVATADPVDYSGVRDADSIIEWLRTNAERKFDNSQVLSVDELRTYKPKWEEGKGSISLDTEL